VLLPPLHPAPLPATLAASRLAFDEADALLARLRAS
jgi:hypothetical protein